MDAFNQVACGALHAYMLDGNALTCLCSVKLCFYLKLIDGGDLAGHVDEDVPACVICDPDWPHREAIMKFGALLRTSAAGAPNLQTLFHCYKLLKKRLKHLPERQSPDHPNNEAEGVSEDELLARQRTFVTTLNDDVAQFNDLFIEKVKVCRVCLLCSRQFKLIVEVGISLF